MTNQKHQQDADLEQEAEWRWGASERYQESARRTATYGPAEWQAIHDENGALLEELAQLMRAGAAPDSEAVRALVERHRLHIDRWYYPTDHWMHARLAEMYAYDERFQASFEQVAAGLTDFVVAGIEANALLHAADVEQASALTSARAGRGMLTDQDPQQASAESQGQAQEAAQEISEEQAPARRDRR